MNDSGDTVGGVLLVLGLLIFAFVGSPDIHDATLKYLLDNKYQSGHLAKACVSSADVDTLRDCIEDVQNGIEPHRR